MKTSEFEESYGEKTHPWQARRTAMNLEAAGRHFVVYTERGGWRATELTTDRNGVKRDLGVWPSAAAARATCYKHLERPENGQ